ncbi:Metallo-peptidase family M12-domain-containing protein [Phlyctochytrium arcticum]|nr:Metallo-peptidase family M12-domain-containing protein [Phlyctochytrium arcticum]
MGGRVLPTRLQRRMRKANAGSFSRVVISCWGVLAVTLIVLAWAPRQVLGESSTSGIPPVRFYDFIHKAALTYRSDSNIKLSFKAIDQTFEFALQPNPDVIHPEAVVYVDGVEALQTTARLRALTSNVLKGQVLGVNEAGARIPLGWARFVVHQNKNPVVFEGSFSIDGELYHIKEIETYRKTRRSVDLPVLESDSRPSHQRDSKLILFKDQDQSRSVADIIPERFGFSPVNATNVIQKRDLPSVNTCGFDPLINANDRDRRRDFPSSLERRAPVGCPTSRRVLFMAAAADCTYVRLHGGKDKALAQILSNWNLASSLYENTFNISLGLINVMLQETCTPNDPLLKWNRECSDSYSINSRLSDFSEWRAKKEADEAGLWHLMTHCPSGASVGVAWLSQVCQTKGQAQVQDGVSQFVSGTGVSAAVNVEWKVVAHEIGHNFGAIHDCTGAPGQCPCTDPQQCNCCPCTPDCNCQGKFLMHPNDSATSDQFSPCTISSICGAFPKFGTCLKEPGALQTIAQGICGNGIREGNEQCDCGTDADCAKDPCCDKGCKLRAGKSCSDKNDECCSQCNLKTNGTACRPSSGVCDITETCDGISPTCPTDKFIPDGTGCTINGTTQAACASGQCTSRDLQCRSVQTQFRTTSVCPGRGSDCKMFCQSQEGLCLDVNSYFVDGTPCGFSGASVCQKGNCESGNIVQKAADWISSHPQIAIPILVLVGILVLSILFSMIRCLCCPTKKKPSSPRSSRSRSRRQQPQPQPQYNHEEFTPQWVDPSPYNGPSLPRPPPNARSRPS